MSRLKSENLFIGYAVYVRNYNWKQKQILNG